MTQIGGKMPLFTCRYCSYKTNKAVMPEKCPYCSNKSTMAEEESADDLLNSSD